MSARDKIIEVLTFYAAPDIADPSEADLVISKLLDAGYVILSQSELQAIRDEALEQAAAVIEAHDEVTNLRTGKRLLHERVPGNLVGLAYVEAIRNLKSRPALARAEQPE